MVEMAVEMEDEAMEAYLEGKEIDIPTLKRVVSGDIGFEICADAVVLLFKNKGVQTLLDAVVDFLQPARCWGG